MVAAVGLVENMTGGNAYKLGDVVTARSGTTIEIHNTDAEGRVVLADVLDVVADLNPECIIDAATPQERAWLLWRYRWYLYK